MPISPMPIRPTPSLASRRAMLAPVAMAARAADEVGGAVADAAVLDLRVRRQRRLDAHVDDQHACVDLAGQHVDGGAAAREVHHHVGGDFLRVGADAFLGDAVVGAHDDDRLGRDRRLSVAGDGRDLASEILQPTEATARLRLVVQQALDRRRRFRVDGRNSCRQGVELIEGGHETAV
jgi:hypothetical protein